MKQWYLQITSYDEYYERYGVRFKLKPEDRTNEEYIKGLVANWREALVAQVGEPKSFSYIVTNYLKPDDDLFQKIEE